MSTLYAYAQSSDTSPPNQDTESTQPSHAEFIMGVDSWALWHDVPAHPEAINDSITAASLIQEAALPDFSPASDYQKTAAWATIFADYAPSNQLKLTVKALHNQAFGTRLDELSADYVLPNRVGFRAGVLDYKMSWCKDYEADNPWIQDPNQFCSSPENKNVAGAAPGVQIYGKHSVNGYLIQSLAGFYNAKAWGYSDLENGRRTFVKTQPTLANHKYGASINILNPLTATEYRISWLHSDIVESPEYPWSPGNNHSQQRNDTLYLAAQTPLSKRFMLGANLWYFESQLDDLAHLRNTAAYDYGFYTKLAIKSFDIHVKYLASGADSYIAGYTLFNRRKLFTPIDLSDPSTPEYAEEDERFNYTRQAISMAWRHEWARNLSSVVQLIHTDLRASVDISLPNHPPIDTAGNGLGVRLQYKF